MDSTMRVLVVDDTATFVLFLKEGLEKFGYAIEAVSSGEKAIERLRRSEGPPIDAVILDQVMPEMSGFETFQKMKELKVDVPTIMVTAHSSITLAIEFLKAGGSDYVEKPVPNLALLDCKLKSVVERENARKASEKARIENEAAKRVIDLKAAFLANVSHDVRSHLSGVGLCVEFAKKYLAPEGNEKTRGFLDKAQQGTASVLELLSNTLALSRLEAGCPHYAFQEGDLHQAIRKAVSNFEMSAGKKGISVEFDGSGSIGRVTFDPIGLNRVFSNLIGNAVKFSSEAGNILISLTEDSHSVTVAISDDGVGIPETEISTIFDRFARSSRTRRTNEGTGLGLAICREIVSAHKGAIWAENNPSGKGATFYVRLSKEKEFAL